MTGIAIISHANGWAITNDALIDTDKFIIEVDGQKVSKSVQSIKLNNIFDTVGEVIENQQVECLFKTYDDKKYAFVGTVKLRGKQSTVIHELFKSERYTEILNKIKTCQILKT